MKSHARKKGREAMIRGKSLVGLSGNMMDGHREKREGEERSVAARTGGFGKDFNSV